MSAPAIVQNPRLQWLAARRELITASDVAAVIGEDPRRGALAVYAAKVGDIEQDETVPMRRGRRFEGAIADEYADQTGRPVSDLGAYVIQRHPDIPWLGATLDRVTVGSGSTPAPADCDAPLQIKMAIGSAREWKDGPPLHYVVQVQTEMACFGATWGALAALVGPGPLAAVDLVRDDAFFAALVPQLERFRWHVEKRIPPEADATPGTSAAIRRLWAGEDGQTIALGDEDLALVADWEAAKASKSAAEETVELLGNRLRARLQTASFGALPDGRFLTLKLTKRDGYAVQPTSFRTLRVMCPRIRGGK
jgi:putative phage-type endonuclease